MISVTIQSDAWISADGSDVDSVDGSGADFDSPLVLVAQGAGADTDGSLPGVDFYSDTGEDGCLT